MFILSIFFIELCLIFLTYYEIRRKEKSVYDYFGIAVIIAAILFIGYGLYLQHGNGFVSPYYFGK